ncbi:protein unc-13 homolog [Neltuma alba]|uniref:protein unc-13 homolog n=1 Tax=Neltuma alba TaxID=207710 RepID=UPI0010A56139|nr:protein unc-13 homolog [Prosopis alba]
MNKKRKAFPFTENLPPNAHLMGPERQEGDKSDVMKIRTVTCCVRCSSSLSCRNSNVHRFAALFRLGFLTRLLSALCRMGQHARRESYPSSSVSSRLDHMRHHPRRLEFPEKDNDVVCPFGNLEGLDQDDIRETAYEIFFTACRSSPGFGGGRNALTFHSSHENGDGGGSKPNQVVSHPTSRVKRALGLKMLKRSPSRRMVAGGSSGVSSTPSSPVGQGGGSPLAYSAPLRPRRPMTSAEIMRQQMRVTEQSDNRLRKTLMRTLVGQMGRRAETIILPLELLRQLKPSEFNDSNEYHMWQKRQLKIMEAGLLLHPSIPLEKNNTFAMRLRDIIKSGNSKPLDTGKNSDTMRTLCNSVVSLSWRSANGTPTDVCHWVDGYPVNMYIYTSLLQAIFDIRDETLVLDEVDELLELMKKTWSTLGISRPIHNVCFTWVLFLQYVETGQVESDLLSAAYAMLIEVAADARKEKEALYVKILTSVLGSLLEWAEKKLVNYHEYYVRGTVGQIENLLPLVLLASKILGEDVTISEGEGPDITIVDSSGDRIEYYIRSSLKNAFDKMIDAENEKAAESEIKEEMSQILVRLAQKTEELAMKERESFSPVMSKWQPTAGAVAAMTLHNCYGHVLRQYLGGVISLTTEMVEVLQRAGRLEKLLVQMVVEESTECDDGGKTVVREMVPYEVDSVVLNFLRRWIDESLDRGKEYFLRAKEIETWNPKSKSEQHALSAVELMNLAKATVEEFFKIPIGITEDLVLDLAEGVESIVQNYTSFVAACGSKQSYIPSLPPLTRCNRDSKFLKLWRKAAPCSMTSEEQSMNETNEGHHPRPSTSRGTQRLYVRLNTLHYMLSCIQSLDKSLSLKSGVVPSSHHRLGSRGGRPPSTSGSAYFDIVATSIQAACHYVSEVAAYRLIFLDSSSVFYDGLYLGDVANSRIRPALRTLKQNLAVMTAILTDRAQALAMKEVMKASFESFLMVLLAGGSSRVFNRSDHQMIQEDFESLKKVFCTCGEGLIAEEVVQREAEVVEGVIDLMGQSTDQLVEDFSIITCETSGIGVMGIGQKLPMPPTTGRWNRSDPNTILRVLCHRNDGAANQFLKRTFQLAKRR